MPETEQAETKETSQQTDSQQPQTQQPELVETPDATPSGAENLDVLLDISMPVTVMLGRTTVPLKRLLQLGQGSVLQLDKSLGQPVDLYVQDIKFATADVVVMGEQFAVRISELLGVESQQQTQQP